MSVVFSMNPVAYSLNISYKSDDPFGWFVRFRTSPTYGIEAGGPSPKVEEVVEALLYAPGMTVNWIPIIMAAHAAGEKT
jgi:hypothetical protein